MIFNQHDIKTDHENEKKIMRAIYDNYPTFKLLKWRHNTDKPFNNFDFTGFDEKEPVIEVDIKYRNHPADRYDSHFISPEKIQQMQDNPERDYFIAYGFSDGKLYLYDLRNCQLTQHRQKYFDQRYQQEHEQDVYKIPHWQFILELWLVPSSN